MHIAAFTPAGQVVMEGSAVTATAVPQTDLYLPPLKGDQVHQITAPILLCVWAENGIDPNPCFYVQARDPDGQTRGNAEIIWLWDDVANRPAKWRVWNLMLPFLVFGEGVYTFGVFKQPDDPIDEALASYPFPIIFDPALQPLPPGTELPPGVEFR
ncbi:MULTISPECIES: hypothetical protein [Mycolicibacter]|uniref:Secreted protein n=2 Tax=Mycolicibacter TaxID=1073531 RepID=A0ABU5XPG6_9MYCO|nr:MULTISPECIES: hypothetical protein [unclassified Mycolicibacter]MEB3022976.1 hypothetical protein [Mycolicibacter sp. MYC098]MEB3033486.1 hypothetical protein [Mycolicibacter sp. MYC340]